MNSKAYLNHKRILELDLQDDYQKIYQLTAFYDFPRDMRDGLTLAFYRVFAIPCIAELLVKTGEMTGRPAKRSYDTGLVIYELIAAGFDAPRGQEMVKLLGRVHQGLGIAQEDFRYVLCTFMVTPFRWIDIRGWRPLLPAEREASTNFYRELGRRMHIEALPETFADAAAILDDYEKRFAADNEAGRALMASTLLVFRNRLPKLIRPLAAPLLSSYFADTKLTDALGLPSSPWILSTAIRLVYALRNAVLRRRPAAKTSWFVPGTPTHDVYPNGYTLDQLGPRAS